MAPYRQPHKAKNAAKHDPSSLFSRVVKPADSKVSKQKSKPTNTKLANNPLFLAINGANNNNTNNTKHSSNKSAAGSKKDFDKPVFKISSKLLGSGTKKPATSSSLKESTISFGQRKPGPQKPAPLTSSSRPAANSSAPRIPKHPRSHQERNDYSNNRASSAGSVPSAPSIFRSGPRKGAKNVDQTTQPNEVRTGGIFEVPIEYKEARDSRDLVGSREPRDQTDSRSQRGSGRGHRVHDKPVPASASLSNRHQKEPPTSAARNIGKFSIKDASLPPVLVLQNLAPGTSSEDVKTVLQNLGTIERCSSEIQSDNTVSAEVLFLNRTMADLAVQQFNGAMADGQIIRASITKSPTILYINGANIYEYPANSQQAHGRSNAQPYGGVIGDRDTNSSGSSNGMGLYEERSSVQSGDWQGVQSLGPRLHRDIVYVRKTRPILRQ